MTLRETMALLISEGVELKKDERGRLDFRIRNYDTSILDVDIPNRGKNAFLKHGINTVGDAIDFMNGNMTMKGLGEKTVRETKQALIEWNWGKMTQEEQMIYLSTLFV